MPRRSSILDHPDRAAIDVALLNGTTLREITGKYGVSRSALGRYKTEYLGKVQEDLAEDPRYTAAKEVATDHAVAELQRIPQILNNVINRWGWISGKLDQLLAEAEQITDFNDSVLQAIDNLSNGDREKANEILIKIGKQLAGDRSDRLAALKEMRLLAADMITAWRDVRDVMRDDSKPFVVEYRVLGRGDG